MVVQTQNVISKMKVARPISNGTGNQRNKKTTMTIIQMKMRMKSSSKTRQLFSTPNKLEIGSNPSTPK